MPFNVEKNRNVRALVLMSGGLDSSIAAKVLLEQGIEVIGLYFYTGFCVTAQKAKTGRKTTSGNTYERSDVVAVAENLGIQLEILDVSKDYVPMVSKPKYGYGKNMNPCIDCRVFMLTETRKLLDFYDADFIATGEVVGQRPKSQKRDTQKLIAKEAEVTGLLVRPLSAKLMPPTVPEEKGWLNRDLLLDLQGRSRKPQMQLAAKWGITEAATPAGGCCFLADETYSARFRDLVTERQNFLDLDQAPPLNQEDVILLGVGRHFKLRPGLRLICGRDQGENRLLEHYMRNRMALVVHPDVKGASAVFELIEDSEAYADQITEWPFDFSLVPPELHQFCQEMPLAITASEIYLASSIIARYSNSEEVIPVVVSVLDEKGQVTHRTQIEVFGFKSQIELEKRMILKK